MKFGPVPLERAEGKILAHNISDPAGRRLLRKGRLIDPEMLNVLRQAGRTRVWVAELDPEDVHEDEAARRVAAVVAGGGLEVSSPHQARVNLKAEAPGILQVDRERLRELNRLPGLTVATLPSGIFVPLRKRAATVKVIPYAMHGRDVEEAEELGRSGAILKLKRLPDVSVGLVLVGGEGQGSDRLDSMADAVRGRVEKMGSTLRGSSTVASRVGEIGAGIEEQVSAGARLVVVAGETAIMDWNDIIPQGILEAGGRIEHFGLPVDPGHLLLLAYLDDVPVVGAPGCIRGSLPDGVDLVLPRLLAGEKLEAEHLTALGHGGLLADPRRR